MHRPLAQGKAALLHGGGVRLHCTMGGVGGRTTLLHRGGVRLHCTMGGVGPHYSTGVG